MVAIYMCLLLPFLVTWPWTSDLLSLSFMCNIGHRKAYLDDYIEKQVHTEFPTAVNPEHLLGIRRYAPCFIHWALTTILGCRSLKS